MSGSFNPTSPAELAAKDQLFQMLRSNFSVINMLAGSSSAKIKEMVNSHHYITELRFMCQVVLTVLEENRPEDEEELCWPPSDIPEQMSPGWKFLNDLVKPNNATLDEKEASVQAAMIMRRLVGECLVEMQSKSDCLSQMGSLNAALKTEVDVLKTRDSDATKDVIIGLEDWLWLIADTEQLQMLTERLAELAKEELTDSIQLEPLHQMQVEIRQMREEAGE